MDTRRALARTGLAAGALAILWSAALSARPDATDREDRQAVEAVCTQCHDLSMFSDTVQSREDWIGTIQEMIDRGATGTDEQFEEVVRYLAEHQSSVNVNTAPAEDIAPVLHVPDAVAQAIVARRAQKTFVGIDDLASIPGIDAAALKARANRIAF